MKGKMRKGNTVLIRNKLDTAMKKKELASELGAIEKNNRLSIAELDRRIMNIPNLKGILKEDSELKRRLKRI